MSKKKAVERPVPRKKVDVEKVIKAKAVTKIDIGCGANKQGPDFVGIDYRDFPGVDIVHDITMFPWPVKDNSFDIAVSSHVVEHINPMPVDPRITGLAKLLLAKKLVTKAEMDKYVGEIAPGPIFMRLMDEIWRILKPGGQFILGFPYAGSPGFWWDPTHINGITEMTWMYFDPKGSPALDPTGEFYKIYTPKPWHIKVNTWHTSGNMEICLEKREFRADGKY